MLFCGEGTSFIASVGVSVILAGLLLYYFNIRLRALERTAQKQNQVLAGFLGGVQGNLVHGELGAAGAIGRPAHVGGGGPSSSATEAARCFAGACAPTQHAIPERIVVSDDESIGAESASDSADDDYTGSETGSGSESEEDVIDLDTASSGVEPPGIKVIELEAEAGGPDAEVAADEGEALVADTIEVLKEAVESCVKESASGRKAAEEPGATAEAVEGETEAPREVTGEDGTEPTTVIERLKVAELRDLAVTKELATSAEARGMKKAQLLELLEPAATEAGTEE